MAFVTSRSWHDDAPLAIGHVVVYDDVMAVMDPHTAIAIQKSVPLDPTVGTPVKGDRSAAVSEGVVSDSIVAGFTRNNLGISTGIVEEIVLDHCVLGCTVGQSSLANLDGLLPVAMAANDVFEVIVVDSVMGIFGIVRCDLDSYSDGEVCLHVAMVDTITFGISDEGDYPWVG